MRTIAWHKVVGRMLKHVGIAILWLIGVCVGGGIAGLLGIWYESWKIPTQMMLIKGIGILSLIAIAGFLLSALVVRWWKYTWIEMEVQEAARKDQERKESLALLRTHNSSHREGTRHGTKSEAKG